MTDFLNGRIPAYVETGLNFVDVEDVAEAHWQAGRRGKTGERYLLGNRNLTLGQFLALLARLTGRKPPSLRLPYSPVLFLALIDEGLSRLFPGRPPAIPLTGVRMARHYMFFDCGKSVVHLKMPQNSLEMTARKTIDWYMNNGYVKDPSKRESQ